MRGEERRKKGSKEGRNEDDKVIKEIKEERREVDRNG